MTETEFKRKLTEIEFLNLLTDFKKFETELKSQEIEITPENLRLIKLCYKAGYHQAIENSDYHTIDELTDLKLFELESKKTTILIQTKKYGFHNAGFFTAEVVIVDGIYYFTTKQIDETEDFSFIIEIANVISWKEL